MVCEACGVGEVGEQWRGNTRMQVGGDEDLVMNEVVAPSAKASHDVLTNSLIDEAVTPTSLTCRRWRIRNAYLGILEHGQCALRSLPEQTKRTGIARGSNTTRRNIHSQTLTEAVLKLWLSRRCIPASSWLRLRSLVLEAKLGAQRA